MDKDNKKTNITDQPKLWGGNFVAEVIETLGQGVTILGADGRIEYTNTTYAKLTGRAPEELVGLSLYDLTHSADHEILRQAMQQRLAGERSRSEVRLVRPDGTLVFVRVIGMPRWEGDNFLGAVTIVTDLTEHRQVETTLDELEAQQQFVQRVLNANPNILYIFDMEVQQIVYQNQHMATTIGYTVAEVNEMGFDVLPQLVHPDDLVRIMEQLNSLHSASEDDVLDLEYRIRHKNGSWLWFHSRHAIFKRGPDGRVQQFIGAATNISDLKRAEAEMQESQGRLAGIIASAMDAIITVDKSQQIVLFNAAAEQMFGIGADEALGQPIDNFIPERFRVEHHKHVRRFGETGVTNRKMGNMGALWALRADGREFPIEASISQTKGTGQNLYTVILRDITEKLQAEEDLRQSQTRYRSAEAIAKIGSWKWDLETQKVTFSDEMYNRFGIDRDSFDGDINQVINSRIHPDDISAVLQANLAVLQEHKAEPLEYRVILPDGTERVLRAEGQLEYDQSGNPAEMVGYVQDITERKRANKAFRESEEKLRLFIEHAPAALAMFDQEMRYLAYSRRWQIDYLLDDSDVTGRSHYEIFPDLPEEWKTAHSRGLAGEVVKADEDSFLGLGGNIQWLHWEIRPWYTAEGNIGGIVIFADDITDQKKTAEALRQSKTELQYILDTVPEGVLLLDADQTVRVTNPVAAQYLTILAPDLADGRLTHLGNRPIRELLTSPPKGLWHEIETGSYAFEAIAQPVEISASDSGWVVITRDVTQERAIQQRAQQQERLAAVGQLAAGISHDFNNVMAVIILYAEIITRTISLPASASKKLHIIEQQAQRATDLIQQILDFTRQAVLERQSLDLLPYMKELIKLLQRTLPESIQITLTYSEESYLIQADPSRIQQVIMNLALNARDAMPGGGQLRLDLSYLRTEKDKPLYIHNLPLGNWIQIEISDTGKGISSDELQHIFEPFFTTKAVGQGTGLGLAQVYGIVKQHDGYIDVMTAVGQGSTFMLYFPTEDTGEKLAPSTDMPVLKEGRGETVLVVEDNAATLQALVDSLTLLNYRVLEATNGREALTILESRADEISAVLSDLVMPEMGGIALLHAMREKKLVIPMIILTGHSLSQDIENSLEPGPTWLLAKPPDLVGLSNMLAQVLAA